MQKTDYTIDTIIVSGILESEDQEPFKIFYEHFYNRIYLFLLRKTNNKEITLELTNETFCKIYLNKQKINLKGNFMGYFYTIALNELRQIMRKKSDIVLEEDVLEFIINSKTADDYSTHLNESLEAIELVESSIKKLSTEEQNIIRLRFYEEKSLKIISDELSLPLGTIKSKISRSISKLRTIIATKESLVAYK